MSSEDKPKDYSESPINLEYFYTAGSATTRFLNQVITEAGICKNDIIELNEAGLLWN